MGVKKTGIDFDSMDGKPSKIFFLTLSPVNKPAPHVKFLSLISQAMNEHGREQILKAKSANEIYTILLRSPGNNAGS
jgi:PTS system nitrogen regulatory IIA component